VPGWYPSLCLVFCSVVDVLLLLLCWCTFTSGACRLQSCLHSLDFLPTILDSTAEIVVGAFSAATFHLPTQVAERFPIGLFVPNRIDCVIYRASFVGKIFSIPPRLFDNILVKKAPLRVEPILMRFA